MISIQGTNHPDARRQHTIVGCQEVIKDEIWVISVYSQGALEEYYILEATCEVIGRQDKAVDIAQQPGMQQIIPRADWSSYISERISGNPSLSLASLPLFERVKWTNREDFDKGISRHWLMKVHGEGQIGDAKVVIAQRYIFACVVANR